MFGVNFKDELAETKYLKFNGNVKLDSKTSNEHNLKITDF